MEYLAGPSLEMSFHDIGFDFAGSSPIVPPVDKQARVDLDCEDANQTAASTSPSTSASSSRTGSPLSDTETDGDGDNDDAAWTSDSSEECGVFFGRKTEREKQYLRSLGSATPLKAAQGSPMPPPPTAARIVRKRDSREFHRRRTMVFSTKDRMSLSVEAGGNEGSRWDVQGGKIAHIVTADADEGLMAASSPAAEAVPSKGPSPLPGHQQLLDTALSHDQEVAVASTPPIQPGAEGTPESQPRSASEIGAKNGVSSRTNGVAASPTISAGASKSAADDSLASETSASASTSAITNDSPLPVSRAGQYMSPRSHMRGDFFASPSLARDGPTGQSGAMSSPLQLKEVAPLVLSPLQDVDARIHSLRSAFASPVKRAVGAPNQLIQHSMGAMATPLRPAAALLKTPNLTERTTVPSSAAMLSRVARTPLQAADAAPHARKGFLKSLPPPSGSKPATVHSEEGTLTERKREITSQLQAAVQLGAKSAKPTVKPSPVVPRMCAGSRVYVPLNSGPPRQNKVSQGVHSLPGTTPQGQPQPRQNDLLLAPSEQTHLAASPSIFRPVAASRPAAATPLHSGVRRTGLPALNRLARRSPTPTDIGSSTGTPGRLGPPVRPGASIVPGSATRNPSRLGRPRLPHRGGPLRPNSSLPLAKPPSTFPKTGASAPSVGRSATAPMLGQYASSVRSTSSQSTTGGAVRPARFAGPMRGGPVQRNGARVPVPTLAVRQAVPADAALPDPPAANPVPIMESVASNALAIEEPLPARVLVSPPRPESTTPATSPTTAEIAPLRALAGVRTPAMRSEKTRLKSKSEAATAVPAAEEPVTEQQQANVGSPRRKEQAAVIEVDATASGPESASSVAVAAVLPGPPTSGPSATAPRPVRARQRSLVAREAPINGRSFASRSTSAPPASSSQVSRFPILDKDLQAVTKRNTMRNEVYFCAITRNLVRRDGPRPPSPTSKIRTVADREEEDRRIDREARAKRRDRSKSRDDTEDEETSMPPTPVQPLKHVRGPGEEEDYETPARGAKRGRRSHLTNASSGSPSVKGVRRKRSRPEIGPSGKSVRWDKGLVLLADGQREMSDGAGATTAQLKSCLSAKCKANLDQLGNVTHAQQALPDVKRSRITVAVICYDGEEPTEPVLPAAPAGKGKAK